MTENQFRALEEKLDKILAALFPKTGQLFEIEDAEEPKKKKKVYTDGSIGGSGLARRLGVECEAIRKIVDKYDIPYYLDENSNRRYMEREQDIITALIKSNN